MTNKGYMRAFERFLSWLCFNHVTVACISIAWHSKPCSHSLFSLFVPKTLTAAY